MRQYLTYHSSVSHPPVVSPDGREQEGHLPLHDRYAGSLSHAVTEVRGQNQSQPLIMYTYVYVHVHVWGKNNVEVAITISVRVE